MCKLSRIHSLLHGAELNGNEQAGLRRQDQLMLNLRLESSLPDLVPDPLEGDRIIQERPKMRAMRPDRFDLEEAKESLNVFDFLAQRCSGDGERI